MRAFLTLKHDFAANASRFLIGLFALFAVDVLQLVIPRIIKFAIDDLATGVATHFTLLRYGAKVLFIALLIGVLRYVWRQLLMGSARRIERSLRDRLFLHLQQLPVSYFSWTKVGDLMALATNDIEAVRMAIAMGFVFLIDTIILGFLTIGFMVYIHPLLTLYSFLPMPAISLATFIFGRYIHQRFEEVQKAYGSVTERVREAISAIRVIKAYVQEEAEKKKLSRLSRDYADKNVVVTRIWGMFFPVVLFFSNLSMIIVLYAGGRLTILQTISPGDLVAFLSYLGILSWPMMALGWATNVVQRGVASMERLNRIFSVEAAVTDSPGIMPVESLKGEIEIRGLSYHGGDGRIPILNDISLRIRCGEKVAIVGRTGAGKTILCNLLTRMLEVPHGCIFVDGIEIHEIPIRTLRRSIGYVPQETFLFSDTIRENIAFGKTDATDEEIEEAARIAQIYDDIISLPEGFNTLIGERGITLSGGQRQRIAIARAILMNPSILILDDALSSVDTQTEDRILTGLERFLSDRTCLFVSHRISPLKRADRIVVIDQGRIVETGNHETLLANQGVYAELYWRGMLEEEIEKEG